MKSTLLLLSLLAGAANTAVLMVLLENRLSWERPLALGVSALALLLLAPAVLAFLGRSVASRTRAGQRFLVGFCLLQLLGLALMGANIAQGRATPRQWLDSLGAAGPSPSAPADSPPVVAAPAPPPLIPSTPPPSFEATEEAEPSPGSDTAVPAAASGAWEDTHSDAGTDTPSDAGTDTPAAEPRFLYQYEAKGTVIVVDELDKVPPRYRKRVTRIPIEEPAASSPSPTSTSAPSLTDTVGRPPPYVQLPPELSDWTEMTLPPDVPRPDIAKATGPAPAAVRSRMFQQVKLQCPAGSELKRELHHPRIPSALKCVKTDPKGREVRHGPFIYTHPDGRVALEGEFREGWEYGHWVRYGLTGERLEEGTYAEGGKRLSHTSWHSNGTPRAAYLLRNGGYDGLVVQWHANGQRESERWFRDGRPQGWEKEWWPNGQLKRQAFTPERGPGKILTWHSNGQRASAHAYRDGRAHGPAFGWYEDGKLAELHENREGLTEGLHESWWPNGQQSGRWPYRKGERHGLGIFWSEDGRPRLREYREGYEVYR